MPPRSNALPLSKRYPYVYAWGTELGSHQYWKDQEAEQAAADDVPEDVIYRHEWTRISGIEQKNALRAEEAGTAVILRTGDGTPCRVWRRFSGIRDADRRARVERYATNLREGRDVHA